MALLERRFAAPRVPLSLILLATGVVLAAGATPAEATFPGSNGRLAFSAETVRPGYAQNTFLYDFNPATGKVRQLTRRPEGCGRSWVDGGMDYSPDGRRIAYLHGDNCAGSGTRSGLWIMSANGRGKRHVASFDLLAGAARRGRCSVLARWSCGRRRLLGSRDPDGALASPSFGCRAGR